MLCQICIIFESKGGILITLIITIRTGDQSFNPESDNMAQKGKLERAAEAYSKLSKEEQKKILKKMKASLSKKTP